MAYQLLAGHLNVYQYLFDTFGNRTLEPVVWAPYLPLYYFIEAGWMFVLRLLRLADAGQWYFDPYWHITNFNRSLLFVKAIYLPFDLGIGYLLTRLVAEKHRRSVWILWLFSPVSLLVTFMMGQNDIMSAFFVVAAVYFGEKALSSKRETPDLMPSLAALLLLSLGAGIKSFPILLVLPYSIVLGRNAWRVFLLCSAGIIPFLVLITPFLRTEAFVKGSLLNPEGQSLLNMSFTNGSSATSVFVMAFTLVILYVAYRRKAFLPGTICTLTFVIVALIFLVGAWPFNWFVWLVPFTVLAVAAKRYLFPLYVVQTAHFLIWTISWGNLLGAGLFTPIYPNAGGYLALRDLVSTVYPYQKLAGISYSVFVIALLAMLFAILRPRYVEQILAFSTEEMDQTLRESTLLVPILLLAVLLTATFLFGGPRA